MSDTALILIDHGSRRDEANDMLVDVAARVATAANGRYIAVEPAHMELAEPTMQQALDRCVEAGARRVVVALFFLSPGRHSTEDIPRMAQAAAEKHPGIEVVVSEPLGTADELIQAILASASRATP